MKEQIKRRRFFEVLGAAGAGAAIHLAGAKEVKAKCPDIGGTYAPTKQLLAYDPKTDTITQVDKPWTFGNCVAILGHHRSMCLGAWETTIKLPTHIYASDIFIRKFIVEANRLDDLYGDADRCLEHYGNDNYSPQYCGLSIFDPLRVQVCGDCALDATQKQLPSDLKGLYHFDRGEAIYRTRDQISVIEIGGVKDKKNWFVLTVTPKGGQHERHLRERPA